MSSTLRRHLTAALGIAASAAFLAGCAIPVPEVEPDPAPTQVQPVLDDPRLENVLSDIGEAIAQADAAMDPALLAGRVESPALDVRTAEYLLQQATADGDAPVTPQPLTTSEQVAVVAATDTWPRTVLVVTQIPDGGNTPLLLGLQQDDPRSSYTLFSWVRLLPGVTMPETAIPSVGSAAVAADAESLVATPAATVVDYADLLTNGAESQFAGQFAEDPYRTLVAQDLANLQTNVAAAGTVAQSTAATDGQVLALATDDGGAIVLGGMVTSQVYERTVTGAELDVKGQLAELAGGDGTVTSKLTATYSQMIAFYAPPAAEGATITVLGVERVLSGVEQS